MSRFSLSSLERYAFPGQTSDFLIGLGGKAFEFLSDDINFLFISCGQNDVSKLQDQFQSEIEVAEYISRHISDWLCHIASTFVNLKILFFPLYLRKRNTQENPRYPISTNDVYINRINGILTNLNNILKSCLCHKDNVCIMEMSTKCLTISDGLHLTEEGKQEILAEVVAQYSIFKSHS